MERFIVMILPLFLMLTLTGCGDIKMQKGAEGYIGSNYEEVIEELNQLGFSNIEMVEIADLTSFGEMADGAVSEMSFDGNTEFVPQMTFPKDTKITVTYHIIKKLSSPVSLDQLSGMNYIVIAEKFTNAGFTNVQMKESYDLDPDETNEEHRNEVRINDATLSKDSENFPFDAVVEVICHYPYEKYDVQLKVDFIGNLIFNKYDVDLLIDGDKQVTLKHGKDWEGTFRIKEGEHTLTFADAEDSSINGEVTLDITSRLEGEYKIFCYGNEITVDTVYLNREIELADNEVKVLCTEGSYLGRDYKEVEEELTELGFTNIRTAPIYDIFFGITEEGSTSDVSINGSDNFNRGDIFTNDVQIVITYHMPYEDEPRSEPAKVENENAEEYLETDENETEYENMNEMVLGYGYVYVRDLMKDLGYTAEYEHEYTHLDFTGEFTYYTDDEINSIGFIITGIKEMDSQKKTITLYVNTAENIERVKGQSDLKETLEKNFDPSLAVSAMEQYGRSQYPYGFSISMVTGRLAETPIDENTWFMKYTCKVTNAAGRKVTMTCEAKIKGPESNPTVYDFYVY